MNAPGYGQWEYRVAVTDVEPGRLESVDGGRGELCFAAESSEPMTIVQALDTWGASGWELVGMLAISGGRLQYVLKRPRHQGGWEGARIHMEARQG
jgi:hypothetical protein